MRRNKGFSLIAVAMIIVVLGALVILSLLPISSGQHDKLIQTQNQLDEIKIALTAYAAQNSGAYPCPASFTDTTNSSTFGSQVNYTANCLSASVTSCAATPGSNILSPSTPKFFCPTTNTTTPTFNQTWIGALPVRDLGLPDSYELDGWGNRFTYVVNNNTNGFFIRKPDNTPIAGVHFHVLSHGPDGVGAYTKSGTRVSGGCSKSNANAAGTWPPTGNASELENCNFATDDTFIYTLWNTSTAATYYDDVSFRY